MNKTKYLALIFTLFSANLLADHWFNDNARKGNTIEHLYTGELLDQARMEFVDQAESSIYLTSFIFTADRSQIPLYEKLCQKAQQGVDVRLLIDWMGSLQGGDKIKHSGKKYEDGRFDNVNDFRDCGIKFIFDGSIRWGITYLPYAKHDKYMVVDGKHLIIGGANYSDDYSAHGALSDVWYDQDVAISGPSACDYHNIFKTAWTQSYSTDLKKNFLKPNKKVIAQYDPNTLRDCLESETLDTEDAILSVYNNPKKNSNRPLEQTYFSMIDEIIADGKATGIKEPLQLFAPYFIPTKQFRAKLIEAAKAGHIVEIITNSKDSIDPEALGSYQGMLQTTKSLIANGVRVYLYNPSKALTGLYLWPHDKDNVFHKKGGIYGNKYIVFGSDNLDTRGQNFSAEAIIVSNNKDLILSNKEIYERDKDFSFRLTEEKRKKLLRQENLFVRGLARLMMPML